VISLGADRVENSFNSIVASILVYRAAAWQHIDAIRDINKQTNKLTTNQLNNKRTNLIPN
jgi:hypothetical protein